MANITTSRATRTREEGTVRRNLTAAATLYHGTIAGFDGDGALAPPGANIRGHGIVLAPDGNSVASGARCDLLECEALLAILSGATVTNANINDVVFAASNHEISDDGTDGEPCGVITGVESSMAWVKLSVAIPMQGVQGEPGV